LKGCSIVRSASPIRPVARPDNRLTSSAGSSCPSESGNCGRLVRARADRRTGSTYTVQRSDRECQYGRECLDRGPDVVLRHCRRRQPCLGTLPPRPSGGLFGIYSSVRDAGLLGRPASLNDDGLGTRSNWTGWHCRPELAESPLGTHKISLSEGNQSLFRGLGEEKPETVPIV
jgi:hypothetical protein